MQNNFHKKKIFINFDLAAKNHVSTKKLFKTNPVPYSPLVEVVFKSKRKQMFRNVFKISLKKFEYVVVQTDSGEDIATVICCGKDAIERHKSCYNKEHIEEILLRHATYEDFKQFRKNANDEHRVVEYAREITMNNPDGMKITDAEWQLDRQKLTIYFTAPGRVDFRDLVKEFAKLFKTKIELRQITTREEAKMIGGVGLCGRALCCNSFSTEYCHVTLEHAKLQQLTHNVNKLSGFCGKLKCCLLYEQETYAEAFKKYPDLHSLIEFPEGMARIQKVDIFKDIVYLNFELTGAYKSISYGELQNLINQGKVHAPPEDHFNQIINTEHEIELKQLKMLDEDII